MNWEDIFKQLGTTTLIVAAVTWLVKQLGQMLIDKDIKLYEQKLNNDSELFKRDLSKTLEEFKASLAFASEKASKLHIKRLEKIEEIYSLLTDFYNDMHVLTTWKVVTGMTKEEIKEQEINNVKKAGESGNKFLDYYAKNKLYFNSETCLLIDEIIKLLKDSHSDFSFRFIFQPIDAKYEMERIKEATDKIREKVPKVKEKLEENFRRIIGVS